MRKIRYRSILLCALASLATPQIAPAYDYGNAVSVCNKGDIDLHYVAFGTNESFLGGHTAKISAWHKVETGDCEDVALSGYETVALGFLQTNDEGVTGNPVYVVRDATRTGEADWAPGTFCLPVNDRLVDDSTYGVIRDRYKPPCKDGFAPLNMSFGVVPNGSWPHFDLKPEGSGYLHPWPASITTQTPSTPKQDDSMSNAEIAGNVLLELSRAIENGKIGKVARVCEKSVLTLAFAFSNEGPAQACKCIATNIVRKESSSIVDRMISDIDANKDFEAVYGHVTEANLERHMENCLMPVN